LLHKKLGIEPKNELDWLFPQPPQPPSPHAAFDPPQPAELQSDIPYPSPVTEHPDNSKQHEINANALNIHRMAWSFGLGLSNKSNNRSWRLTFEWAVEVLAA
jgi:hypothetical protein